LTVPLFPTHEAAEQQTLRKRENYNELRTSKSGNRLQKFIMSAFTVDPPPMPESKRRWYRDQIAMYEVRNPEIARAIQQDLMLDTPEFHTASRLLRVHGISEAEALVELEPALKTEPPDFLAEARRVIEDRRRARPSMAQVGAFTVKAGVDAAISMSPIGPLYALKNTAMSGAQMLRHAASTFCLPSELRREAARVLGRDAAEVGLNLAGTVPGVAVVTGIAGTVISSDSAKIWKSCEIKETSGE
jgi:hypothetical protein